MEIKQINRLKEAIKRINEDGYIFTPIELCSKMLNSLSNHDGNILVIRNIEFIFVMRHNGFDMSKIYYATNCESKKKIAISLGIEPNKIIVLQYNSKEILIQTDMKFDVIIQNPPYGKLHIPFLKWAVDHKTDNGEIRSIQPIEKIQSNYDKNDLSWLKPNDIEIITATDATKLFNAKFAYDLGIIKINKTGGFNINDLKFYNNYFNSINLTRITSLHDHFSKVKSGDYFVEFALTHGNCGALDEYELFSTTKMEVNKECKGTENKRRRLYFNTKIEAKNFIKSCRCITYYFIKRIGISTQSTNPMQFMPFMQDYTKVYTDKDYCDIFKIDYNIVKKEMSKYISQVKKSYSEYEPNI